MPTIAELIKKATGSSPEEMAQAVKTLEYMYGTTPMGQQDFGPEDSTIASTVAHPIKGAGKLAEWFRGNINTAAGYSDPFDNPNPLLGPSMDKKAEAGLNLAGMLQTGAMPFAPKSAGGTLGTFIGPKAANWDSIAADKATKLLDSGADPAQVWKEHLIGRMPDKSLFSEIPDDKAATQGLGILARSVDKEAIAQGAPKGFPQWVWMNHDELYKNYPEFKNIYVNPTSSIDSAGSFDAGSNMMNLSALGDNPDSTTLHELQHAIQQREGWARGGSPESFTSDINALKELNSLSYSEMDDFQKTMFKQLTDQYGTAKTPTEAYQRLTGEAQARATQDRMNMNMDERRNSYPLAGDKLSDIPLKNLISRYK